MITPQQLVNLSAEDEQKADAAEVEIDSQIQTAFDADPEAKTFEINRAELSKKIGGMNIKTRTAVTKRYTDAGWKVSENGDTLTFKMPRTRKAAQEVTDDATEPTADPQPAATA